MIRKILIAVFLAAFTFFITDVVPYVPQIYARMVEVQHAVDQCMVWDAAPEPNPYANCNWDDIAARLAANTTYPVK